MIFIAYQFQGAYLHANEDTSNDGLEAVYSVVNVTQHFCFSVLKEPYEYLAAKMNNPPDDGFVSAGASWLTIVFIFAWVDSICCWRIFRIRLGSQRLVAPSSEHRHKVLAGNSGTQDTKFSSAW